jgi:hypothetical protein
MTTYVADFSFSHPSPQALKQAGYVGAISYCSWEPNPKNITAAQVAAYLAAGVQVGLVWETVNQEASYGAPAGTRDATEYLRQAKALGATGGVLSMVAEDPNREPVSDYSAIDAYLQAAGAVLHPAGFQVRAYGSESYCEHAVSAGVADRAWIVGGWSQSIMGDLVQQSDKPGLSTLGGQVDCNYAPSAAWGWTVFAGSPPNTPSVSPTHPTPSVLPPDPTPEADVPVFEVFQTPVVNPPSDRPDITQGELATCVFTGTFHQWIETPDELARCQVVWAEMGAVVKYHTPNAAVAVDARGRPMGFGAPCPDTRTASVLGEATS